MSRSIPVLLLAAACLWPAATTSAAPAEDACSLAGRALTVTAPAGAGSLQVASTDGTGLSVQADGTGLSCPEATYGSFDQVLLRDVDGSVTTWRLAEPAPHGLAFDVGNEPTDTLVHTGSLGGDAWTAVDVLSYSTDADPEAEVTIASVPAATELWVRGGGDVVDFSAWTGDTSMYGGEFGVTTGSVLRGGSGDDYLGGSPYADVLEGNGGDDLLSPGSASDVVDPGTGDDVSEAEFDGLPDTFRASEGRDTLRMYDDGVYDPTAPGGDGHAGEDDTFEAHEVVIGSDGYDRFVAQPEGVEVHGNGGPDRFVSGPGDDAFLGIHVGTVDFSRLDEVTVTGPVDGLWTATATSGGTDTFAFPHTVFGSPGDDVLAVPSYVIRPGQGDDVVGSPDAEGDQRIVAESVPDGADRAVEGAHTEFDYSARTTPVRISMDGVANDGATGEGDQVVWGRLVGGQADDVLVGGVEWDVLLGGPGDDRFDGGPGLDEVSGGAGDDLFVDRYVESQAGEVFRGGSGSDTVSYASRPRGVWAVLGVHPELVHPASYDLLLGVERLVGTAYRDVLGGSDGADVLAGGRGRDVLRGYGGADLLRARDGEADTVRGGDGRDAAYLDRIDDVTGVESRHP